MNFSYSNTLITEAMKPEQSLCSWQNAEIATPLRIMTDKTASVHGLYVQIRIPTWLTLDTCLQRHFTSMRQSHLCPSYCQSVATAGWLKCDAINNLIPWVTSICTLLWMMLSRHDWLAKVRGSPPGCGFKLLFKLILVLYMLIYQHAQFLLACVNLHLHDGNRSLERPLSIAILSGVLERMPD